MPDLITHSVAGHLVARVTRLRHGLVLLVIGSTTPDLLSRLPVRVIRRNQLPHRPPR